jgi:hypothetical protein
MALANQQRAVARSSPLNSSTPKDAQQALYMLPQRDYNVIAGGNNGYSAGAGYNLVTGLGTPVANLLVADLAAYQGAGTSYSGATVAPLQDASLVNTGSTNSGPMDVFSVFDSITLAHGGVNRKLAGALVDSLVERGPSRRDQPTQRRAAIASVDRVLEVLQDESAKETFIGDLAFEQVVNNPHKVRAGGRA